MSGASHPMKARVLTNSSDSLFLATAIVLLAAPALAQDGVIQEDSDTDRVPLHTVIPEYPKLARRDRVEGEVQVCFNISRSGHPRRIAVRTSTNRLFERPSMAAVRQSTWVPLTKDEEVPGIKACRSFRFSLIPVEEGPDQP